MQLKVPVQCLADVTWGLQFRGVFGGHKDAVFQDYVSGLGFRVVWVVGRGAVCAPPHSSESKVKFLSFLPGDESYDKAKPTTLKP